MLLREASEDNNFHNVFFLINEYTQSSLKQSINKADYLKELLKSL